MIRTQAVGVGKIPHPLSSHHSVSLSHFTKPLRFAFSHSFPAVAMSPVPRKRRRRSSKNPSTFLSSSLSLDDNFNITSSSAAVTASSPSSPPPQPEKVSFIFYFFLWCCSCFLALFNLDGFLSQEEEDDVKRKAPDIPTLFRRFWKVAAPYWWSDDKVQARLQLAAVFALTLGTTGISVGFNFLGRDFYNALASEISEFSPSLYLLIHVDLVVNCIYLFGQCKIRTKNSSPSNSCTILALLLEEFRWAYIAALS